MLVHPVVLGLGLQGAKWEVCGGTAAQEALWPLNSGHWVQGIDNNMVLGECYWVSMVVAKVLRVFSCASRSTG